MKDKDWEEACDYLDALEDYKRTGERKYLNKLIRLSAPGVGHGRRK